VGWVGPTAEQAVTRTAVAARIESRFIVMAPEGARDRPVRDLGR
jgi:hypothetical protein